MLKTLLIGLKSTLARWMLPALLALALAAIGTGYGWIKAEQRAGRVGAELAESQDSLKRALAARKADAKVLARLRTRQAQEQAKSQAAARELAAAILQYPTWADSPVPKEVQDALSTQ